jgi:Carboxypeptidase regulatory-like domain
MNRLKHFNYLGMIAAILMGLAGAGPALAQTGTGALQGQVFDPSGAVVAGAAAELISPSGKTLQATTGKDGVFEWKELAPGKYALQIAAKGFALYSNDNVEIAARQVKKLRVSLSIEVQQQKVQVSDQSTAVDTSPENNVGAIVISGQELDALPDDPDELQADLQALAGPSAGPNGGQFYIDGFTAGQLPPKSSIREIRINQNPFSAEYDKVGYGRVEIFTKPGTDKWHGRFAVTGNDSAFNSKNPYFSSSSASSPQYPGYYTVLYEGDLSGPLGKRASFFLSGEARNINTLSIVNAQTLNPQFEVIPVSAAVSTPRTRDNFSGRVDYQVSKNNTLSARYQFFRNDETNNGIGGFTLPSQAYNSLDTEQTLQVSDMQIFGARTVNETRFQYIHDGSSDSPFSTDPSLIVAGAFNGGGSNLGNSTDTTNRYELQNYTSIQFLHHFLRFGGRLRGLTDDSASLAGFNGLYIFPSLQTYQMTLEGLEQGATQFQLTAGSPSASVGQVDVGLFAEDDWRIRPTITLSYGLRFESQNEINDHADWAPRLGFAWAIGGGKAPPKTVLRAGFGIFYDRFSSGYDLQAARQNGVVQTQYVYSNPTFFPGINPPPTIPGTIYRVAPNIHAPYTIETAVTLERQLAKSVNLSLTYLHSQGGDQLYLNNINTPLPGTYIYPYYSSSTPGARPNPNYGNIYEYESGGIYRQNQFFAQTNVRAGARLLLFAFYTLNYANSDTSAGASFPSNPFNLMQDYGRASFDVRNRFFLGGNIALPWGVSLSPFLFASSGSPYNITLSQDLIGSSQFNQRPAFATSLSNPANVVTVPGFGSFDTVPQPGEALVPVNALTGPGRFSLNFRLSKSFGFGGRESGNGGEGNYEERGHHHGGGNPYGGHVHFDRRGAGDERYTVTFSIFAHNVMNNVNPATPGAVLNPPTLTSPASYSSFFGVPNALAGGPFSSAAGNRLLYLQMAFSF